MGICVYNKLYNTEKAHLCFAFSQPEVASPPHSLFRYPQFLCNTSKYLKFILFITSLESLCPPLQCMFPETRVLVPLIHFYIPAELNNDPSREEIQIISCCQILKSYLLGIGKDQRLCISTLYFKGNCGLQDHTSSWQARTRTGPPTPNLE